MWSKSSSLTLSRIMVLLFLLFLTAGSVGLPWLVRWYIGYYGKSLAILTPTLVSLWSCATLAFAALYYLGKMLKNISREHIFIRENVHALRVISWCCFAVALIFLLYFFYYVLGLILSVLAAFIGLILRVVKNVFEQAIELKEENDLTV